MRAQPLERPTAEQMQRHAWLLTPPAVRAPSPVARPARAEASDEEEETAGEEASEEEASEEEGESESMSSIESGSDDDGPVDRSRGAFEAWIEEKRAKLQRQIKRGAATAAAAPTPAEVTTPNDEVPASAAEATATPAVDQALAEARAGPKELAGAKRRREGRRGGGHVVRERARPRGPARSLGALVNLGRVWRGML